MSWNCGIMSFSISSRYSKREYEKRWINSFRPKSPLRQNLRYSNDDAVEYGKKRKKFGKLSTFLRKRFSLFWKISIIERVIRRAAWFLAFDLDMV